MGNLDRFRITWRDHRDAVRDLRAKRDEQVQRWQGYAGSKEGDARIKEVDESFQESLSALRADYGKRINAIIQDMKAKAEATQYDPTEPPTEEQVRTLQAASLMTSMSFDDFHRIAKLCMGNRLAMDTLVQLAKERMPESMRDGVRAPDTIGDRALTQLQVIARSSRALASWDGASRNDAVDEFMQEKEAGVPVGARTSLEATEAARTDPTTSSEEFFHDIIGILYDAEAVGVLD